MVLDTSAVLAILFGEPEADRMMRAVASAPRRLIGAPALVEASAVLMARKGVAADVVLDAWLRRVDLKVAPLGEEGAEHARRAYARWGKGLGDPPVLNYGDCLSYGVAMASGEPLLFRGEDFRHTDVAVAPY
ncbi:MAG TPA: type II toxin-antitoxin system VapC family toxin [Longimicrobiales bacterium]|nr:type II toxin-antitoxin system VapC family toxin [Longimicrobiales bacterium]